MNLLSVEVSKKVKRMACILSIFVIIIFCSNIVLAQGINFPLGNPTGTGGAGNARTDSDNFFIRNNLAGLTEIPLNDEEEKTGIKIGADKGAWRFNGEIRALAFRSVILAKDVFNGNEKTSQGTSLNPNFASELTYTSKDHRFGFGVGAYQIVSFNNRLKVGNEDGNPLRFFDAFDTRINSTDVAIGGAVRIHKNFSVGGSFIFGKGFIVFEEPAFANIQNRLYIDGFGAPGLSVGVHYRPNKFLSFGANYKSKRTYTLEGRVKQGQDFNIRASTKLEIPTIAEAGLEFKPFRKLLVATDFRFYDYTATLQYPFTLKSPDVGFINLFFGPQFLFALDVHSFHVGGKYLLNDKTNLQLGFTTNSNTTSFLRRDLKDLGVAFSGAIGRRVGNQWLTAGFAVLPGRTRADDFFFNNSNDNSKDRGFLFSISLRMKQ